MRILSKPFIAKLFLLLPVVVLISCSERSQLPGKAFEGKITQKITLGGGFGSMGGQPPKTITAPPPGPNEPTGPSVSVTMFTKGDKVAYNVPIPMMGDLHFIVDRNSRTLSTVIAGAKMAYVSDLRELDKTRPKVDDSIRAHHSFLDSLEAHMPKPTGSKKNIHGLMCEEYKSTFSGMDVTLWLTQDPRLKSFDILRDAFLGKQQTGLGGLEEALAILAPVAGDGHIPVVTEISKDGKIILKSEMTEMEEQAVDDDVFVVPKGYTIQNDKKASEK